VDKPTGFDEPSQRDGEGRRREAAPVPSAAHNPTLSANCHAKGPSGALCAPGGRRYARSKRSRFITLLQAATKSLVNLRLLPLLA